MNERLIEGLSAWEAGDLSLGELERLQDDPDVRALVAMYERLSAIAVEPVPAPESGWVVVQERIGARPTAGRGRAGRVLVVAVAAALLSASAALAAPGAVNAVVDGVRHGMHSLLWPGQPSMPPAGRVAPSSGLDVPGAGGSASSATGAAGGGSTGGSDRDGSGSGGSGSGGSGEAQGGSGSGSDGGSSQGSDGNSGDQQSVGSDQSGDGGSGSGDQQPGSGDQSLPSPSGD